MLTPTQDPLLDNDKADKQVVSMLHAAFPLREPEVDFQWRSDMYFIEGDGEHQIMRRQ
jgi:hypothetical protein